MLLLKIFGGLYLQEYYALLFVYFLVQIKKEKENVNKSS